MVGSKALCTVGDANVKFRSFQTGFDVGWSKDGAAAGLITVFYRGDARS